MTLAYELLSPILDEEIAVDLVEYNWRHSLTGAPVTRDQLMKVLANVCYIYIYNVMLSLIGLYKFFVNISQMHSVESVVGDE